MAEDVFYQFRSEEAWPAKVSIFLDSTYDPGAPMSGPVYISVIVSDYADEFGKELRRRDYCEIQNRKSFMLKEFDFCGTEIYNEIEFLFSSKMVDVRFHQSKGSSAQRIVLQELVRDDWVYSGEACARSAARKGITSRMPIEQVLATVEKVLSSLDL